MKCYLAVYDHGTENEELQGAYLSEANAQRATIGEEGVTILEMVPARGRTSMTGEKLACILADCGVVDDAVVSDPMGYDGGKTMDAIYKAAEAVRP